MPLLQERLAEALADRFDLVRQLGRGGMATVWLAVDRPNDREVALKVLDPELAAAVGGERFRREVDIATKLRHPHILPIWEAGEAAGSLYCVMPVATGESLRQRLTRESQLPVDVAVRLACEVAEALAHAHAHGVIHRDIKPENVLLQDDHALVADFGIARAVSDGTNETLTRTGTSLGTPAYMSPEQIFGEKTIDGRADVYSLGCMLYEMLAGTPPYTGATAQQVLARHSMDTIPRVTIVRQNVPEHVEDAIVTALAKAPVDRFATAAAFAEALRAPSGPHAARGRRAVQRPTSPERRTARTRRVLYSIAAAVPVLVAAGLGLRWMRGSEASADVVAAPAAVEAQRRVAVLPFTGADDELAAIGEGFADAAREALRAAGGAADSLAVVSEVGVEPFRNAPQQGAGADSVARALDVGTIVRGSVRRDGARLVATIRLVDGATGREVGRDSAVGPAAALRALRDAVSARVAARVGERAVLRVAPAPIPDDVRADGAWLLARGAERAMRDGEAHAAAGEEAATAAAFARADSLWRAARAADPAALVPLLGHGRLAFVRASLADGFERSRLADEARALADSAVGRAPRDARALTLRGTAGLLVLKHGLEPNPQASRAVLTAVVRDLEAATAADPSSAEAWARLSEAYDQVPDIAKAGVAAGRAYEADRYLAAPDILSRLWAAAYNGEAFPRAVKWCDEAHARFPRDGRFAECRLWLASVPGRRVSADTIWGMVDAYRRTVPAAEWPMAERKARILAAGALARAGLADSAERVLVAARADAPPDPEGELSEMYAVMLATAFDDPDAAMKAVEEFLATNQDHRVGLAKNRHWWYRELRKHPRWRAVVGG